MEMDSSSDYRARKSTPVKQRNTLACIGSVRKEFSRFMR